MMIERKPDRARQALRHGVADSTSFDWTSLYWYFVRFAEGGSPFDY
jgi:hypothetical protein